MPSEEYFRDRVVFIGVSSQVAPGVPGDDSFPTPVSNTPMYGVEIHATIAANLMDRTWIRRYSPESENMMLGFIGFWGGLLLVSISLPAAMAIVVATAVAWSLLSYLCFSYLLLFVPGTTLFWVVLPMVMVIRILVAKRKGRK